MVQRTRNEGVYKILDGYSQHLSANEMRREIVRLSARYEVTEEEEEKKGEMLY